MMSEHDWAYMTAPQKYANGEKHYWPRGGSLPSFFSMMMFKCGGIREDVGWL